jgi:hypothetical protein
MGKIYCFDLDGTLCTINNGQYEEAKPYLNRINKVNELYDNNNHIIIETARGSVSGIDWFDLTNKQLNEWGIKFHELRTGVKFYADFYIDDKSNDLNFFD